MSRFCGEFCFAGGLTERSTLIAMAAAMHAWAAGSSRWQQGPLALAACASETFAPQPLIDGELILVAHARFDDRPALGRALGLPVAELAALSDTQLLARAWRHWGERCAEHVYGDWVCAIWDSRQQSLWLGRDAAGNTGLYYWHDAQRLVFATSLKALLAHPAVPQRPDAYQIARQLTVIHDPTQDAHTAYQNIHRLPGGHALRCSRAGVQTYGWWQPEALPEFNWTHSDDYYAAFRELYAAAVADRLQKTSGSVAIMLSAGRDSGSVAALAAPQLAAQGERLLAYTSVPHFPAAGASKHRLGDEQALAQATAAHIGNIDFTAVAAAHSGVLAGIEDMLALHDQAGHAAANFYWILEILRLAQQQGVRVLLTGQGGNASVSWAGIGNLWPALRGGDWASCWSAMRSCEIGLWPSLKRQMLKPALLPLQQTLERLKKPDPAPWAAYSAIHPQFATSIGLHQRMLAAGHDPSFRSSLQPRDSRWARFRLGRLGSAQLGSLWMECGAAHQLDVRDPTRDRRLLEFCWQVPDSVFWANGRQRGLLVKGMPQCLPASVLHSQRKGLQAADLGHRVLAEKAQIVAALDRLAAHPQAREWLDIPRMRAVLATLEQQVNPQTTQQTGTILLRGLSVGLFLLRF